MEKRTTQLLSVLLALCIALALLPGTALAMGYFDPETGAITGCDNEETELNIPSMINGVPITSINYWAFHGHGNLISVTIPESITSIGFEAFLGCTSLTSINVASGNPEYSSVGGVLFNADQTVLIAYPAGKSDQSYSIPASVTTIGLSAFACSDNLTSVTIPDSVTSIEQRAFYRCRSLTGVTIPGSVTTIGRYAFEDCRSLTGVTIPDSITSIGGDAFSGCNSLTSVTIPDSITSIGSNAFFGCNSLTDVYYSGSESQWEQIDIGSSYGADNPLLNATIHYNSAGPASSAPAPETIPATGTAHPSAQTVALDGKQVDFQMYALLNEAGDPTNYIRVRDLAMAMNGTKGQFNVDWIDGAVTLVAGAPYTTPNGSENTTPFSDARSYKLPENSTNVNGAAGGLTAFVLTDDEGGDHTYYQLRDLGRALGFNVGWSAERGVFIESDKPYTDAD